MKKVIKEGAGAGYTIHIEKADMNVKNIKRIDENKVKIDLFIPDFDIRAEGYDWDTDYVIDEKLSDDYTLNSASIIVDLSKCLDDFGKDELEYPITNTGEAYEFLVDEIKNNEYVISMENLDIPYGFGWSHVPFKDKFKVIVTFNLEDLYHSRTCIFQGYLTHQKPFGNAVITFDVENFSNIIEIAFEYSQNPEQFDDEDTFEESKLVKEDWEKVEDEFPQHEYGKELYEYIVEMVEEIEDNWDDYKGETAKDKVMGYLENVRTSPSYFEQELFDGIISDLYYSWDEFAKDVAKCIDEPKKIYESRRIKNRKIMKETRREEWKYVTQKHKFELIDKFKVDEDKYSYLEIGYFGQSDWYGAMVFSEDNNYGWELPSYEQAKRIVEKYHNEMTDMSGINNPMIWTDRSCYDDVCLDEDGESDAAWIVGEIDNEDVRDKSEFLCTFLVRWVYK